MWLVVNRGQAAQIGALAAPVVRLAAPLSVQFKLDQEITAEIGSAIGNAEGARSPRAEHRAKGDAERCKTLDEFAARPLGFLRGLKRRRTGRSHWS
jgi:hypothetical protein